MPRSITQSYWLVNERHGRLPVVLIGGASAATSAAVVIPLDADFGTRADAAHLACARVMTRDDDLRVRIGRIHDTARARRAKPFIAQALAAAEKAGGLHRRSGRGARSAAFGRGRAASLAATRLVTNRTRSVTVKARIVRQRARGAALSAHLAYLRREGAS